MSGFGPQANRHGWKDETAWHQQARRHLLANFAYSWRPFGIDARQATGSVGGRIGQAQAVECDCGCTGQQDGANDLGHAGA